MDNFDGPDIDLVEHYGSMLPIIVICEMLGIPTDERQNFLRIGDRIARSVDPDVPVDEKLAASEEMREYVGGLISMRRGSVNDDIISRLIDANVDGMVDDVELVINTGTLLLAGFETTTNLITNAVYRLLEYPDQLQRLLAEPSLIRTCIEEVLRFDPPSQFMRPRTIIVDTIMGGVQLRPGDGVVPMLAAANRDPEEFADPETFDIGRSPNRHLSFGVGHHLCVGSSLARMEAQTAVLRLFERFPDLALSQTEQPVFRPNIRLRGFASLPIRLG
jgi:cytochrome P450